MLFFWYAKTFTELTINIMPDPSEALKGLGVKEILLQDTPPDTIVESMRRLVAKRGPR